MTTLDVSNDENKRKTTMNDGIICISDVRFDESCRIASSIRKNADYTTSGINKMERQKIKQERKSLNLEYDGAEAGRTYKMNKDTK
ncbi:6824_t:CDS:2 [Funneliformis geosporum]|uniref:791_t:CDS:1 n=1 Tax=Funneliformis geosporum TaxID=1117311 RepID=A0A9W4SS40_9GLOM|nr:791_t:CDS:2 [Funneliformis geosporum]CAI2188681.1 6824_t:CDS:2 [Funneliformis geosporum]